MGQILLYVKSMSRDIKDFLSFEWLTLSLATLKSKHFTLDTGHPSKNMFSATARDGLHAGIPGKQCVDTTTTHLTSFFKSTFQDLG